ncbi:MULTISPECIES: flagellar export protein FliJ [unclassified Clostridioides]|uniref:flagellar export protein FliJ n=1 Tax=unclassified Clostridioides TaxID=2635829 RepID=UPI001D11B41F|nr:flagellar export protein FliJ [Clostridioides sp. ZZV14-6150]MCC0661027.1 flagellar export protein FliJ [Clostridioides sp. ZZV14-6154]MCC0722552.1 flagellar export protein FliJ [Clostridioides sp. ZZV14-6104]MCC0727062.1 flagellar export protein FliJ [Clostridioides sp. ZZV14-6045]MCC0729879.1 flagellar export protein FliJ [Clostridioides sp. ZZV14-6048]MCC0734761.1 flagellar export protein FliJ [Clostridioides sp. ZZV14-6009]MCC0738239.1 flagellar export protein FliJ [Clostridioides sp. 
MELDKNFKFRLQKVLDLKMKDEEKIKMEFAKIQQKKIDIENNLENLESNYNKYAISKDNDSIQNQKITINYLLALNNSIMDLSEELDKSTNELEKARKQLIDKQIERKSLEKLKEKKYGQYYREENLKEQKTNDEFASMSYLRNRQVL